VSDIRDFALPDLGEGLEDGEIVRWHVEVGDVVSLNDPVAEVETAKAVVDVPCPFAGRVVERLGEEGDTVLVGAVLVRIDVAEQPDSGPGVDGVDAPSDAAGPAPSEAAGPEPAEGAAPAGETPAARASTGLDADDEPQPLVGYGQSAAPARRRRRRAAPEDVDAAADAPPAKPLAKPPVRKLAQELGVDLAALAPGSGPEGSITRADVKAAARAAEQTDPAAGTAPAPEDTEVAAPPSAEQVPAPAPAPASPALDVPATGGTAVPGFRGRRPGEVEAIRGVRKRIVDKMETSRRDIPAASCSRDADLTELWELRHDLTAQARSQGYDVKITPFAVVLRAVVLALRRYPTLNARLVGREGDEAGEIHLLEPIHLGVAADTDRGLVVPNIKDAHTRTLLQLALALQELAGRARDGSLIPAELTGGTFTVNNYGAFGNDDGDPIINHPEGAILGIGAIRERPWVVTGEDGASELAIRRVGRFTLAFDHRICDGGEAGRFVTEVATLCEQPARILLHS